MSLKTRIQNIQKFVGVKPDGVIGVQTLSALERALGMVAVDDVVTVLSPSTANLTLSRKGIDKLIAFEVTSDSYYNKRLAAPTWPGGASGVTIGIGYDLGYRTKTAIKQDWGEHLSENHLAQLVSASGIKGEDARGVARSLKQAGVKITLEVAKIVFYTVSLPEFAEIAKRTYPGLEKLPPDAQSAIVSLVYNRGAKLQGSTRVEMANIKPFIRDNNLDAIAAEIESMKRLWVGEGLDGLLKRRDSEARLVKNSVRDYNADELVYV